VNETEEKESEEGIICCEAGKEEEVL